ncbi:MAG: hypothetical protein K2Y22_04670 [Candidatus Obscuribacterales bacterium]|nr:hypothetical protein [Candidatus Obscuribacterales bacterium]
MPDEQNREELIITINSLNKLMQESVGQLAGRMERLEQQIQENTIAPGSTVSAGQPADSGDLLKELQNQVLYLESQINRTTNDIKSKQDEKHNQIRDRLDAQVKVLEKLFDENKKELNKHAFNFALLVLIIIVIGSFIMKSGLDHLTNYVTVQLDHIHIQMDKIMETVQPPSEAPGSEHYR